MEMIRLIKSTFFNEAETKKELCDFIKKAEIMSMNVECRKFEESFSKKQGRKYSAYISSGSSANMLLIQAMRNMGKLNKGDKVFVSGLTWPTNIMPLIQLGLVPVLLDIEKNTLNVSSRILKRKFSTHPDTKCLFLTNALGFCSDIDEIRNFCKKKNIILLEDNCESLGSEYKGNKLGNYGLASTFSFFVGHHLSTIEGGMICTDDKELYETIKSARSHGWTRNNSQEFKDGKKEENNINDFYDIYSFYDLAYNFRPTEINGFIGNLQIKYWDEIVSKREDNFRQFYEAALENPDIVKLNVEGLNIISNFGFPVILKNREDFERYKKIFEENKVEVRPIISGDMKEQPFFKKYVTDRSVHPNTEYIHRNGFYFGNNPEMNEEEIGRLVRLLRNRGNKIGITGASGTLGKILVEKLERSGLGYHCFESDIRSKSDVKAWLVSNQFEAIIHFAAIVPTTEVKANPNKAHQVNVAGTENLVNEIKLSGKNPWLFYASSSHVYKSKGTPINEGDETNPISVYGKTKHEAEKIIVHNYENSCVGRIFSFYHDSQERPFLYPNMLHRLKNEDLSKPFELYGANSVRDFLNAEDVVDIIIDLMEHRVTGVHNIASGEGIKIKDFVQGLSDKKLKIKKMGGQDYLVADISKLNKALGR